MIEPLQPDAGFEAGSATMTSNTEPATDTPTRSMSKAQMAALGVILMLIGGIAGYLVGDDSDRVDRLEGELAAIGDAEDQAAADAAAEAAEQPRLRLLALEHGLADALEGGDDDTVSFNFRFGPGPELEDYLEEIGFNASGVMQRVGNTRALDGTLTAEADDLVATWTYHPDDGLSMVIERTE